MAYLGRFHRAAAARAARMGRTLAYPAMVLALTVLCVGTVASEAARAASPQPTFRLFQPALKADLVLVEKGARRLYLIHKGFIFRSYRIALGYRPNQTKMREGDGRTPEGVYLIDAHNPNSNFHLSLHISYPNSRDMAQAAALGTSPGGMIMIHGLPNGASAAQVQHPSRDWTNGCIAVTNEEIEEIWRFVDDGTPIIIRP